MMAWTIDLTRGQARYLFKVFFPCRTGTTLLVAEDVNDEVVTCRVYALRPHDKPEPQPTSRVIAHNAHSRLGPFRAPRRSAIAPISWASYSAAASICEPTIGPRPVAASNISLARARPTDVLVAAL